MLKLALPMLLIVWMMSKPAGAYAQGTPSNKGSLEVKSSQEALSIGQYQIALKKAAQVIRSNQIPTLVAEAYLIKGNAYLKLEKFELSQDAFLRARRILLSLPDKNTLVHAQYYNDMGHYYFAVNQIEKAYLNYSNCYKIRKKRLGPNSPEAASSKNNIGNCFYAEKKYPEALQTYQEALNILKKGGDKPDIELAALYNNLANSHVGMGDFELAKAYYKDCLAIRKKVLPPAHAEIFHCMRNIGKLFLDLNGLDSAELYIKMAIKGYQKNAAANRSKIADAQMDMSNIYLARGILDSARALNLQAFTYHQTTFGDGDYQTGRSLRQMGQIEIEVGSYAKALVCFQRAESIFETYTGIEDELANLQDDLGNAYSYLGVWEHSLNAHLTSLQLRQSIYTEHHPYIAGSLINLGLSFQHASDYVTAIDYFLKAEVILNKKSVANANNLIRLYNNIGNCCSLQKKYTQALAYYERATSFILTSGTNKQKADYYRNKGQALSHLGQYEQASKFFDRSLQILNYNPSNNPAHLLDPSGVVYSLWFMGNSLKAQYAQKYNDQLLAKASGFYRQAIQIIEGIGSTFVDSKDKLKLSENFKSILEDFLETEFMRYELDKQEVHLYRAFIVSEKNKNIVLNDIWQNRLYSSSNWRTVSSTVAQLEKELMLSENNLKFSDEHRNSLERKLLHQKAQLDSIQKTLAVAAATPKNDPYFPTLHQVMHREQAGLIAYFVGEKSVFAFYVGSKTIRGFQVDRKKIDGLVYTFVSSIIEYPTQTLKAQSATDSTYIESAVGLYQALWLPLFNTVSSPPSRMFISPDGILGFLPFEAMMKHRPVERQRYRTYPFLVWEYEMSYVHTILPFLEQASPQTRSNPLRCLKFAPSFVGHTRGLAELSHNQEEVKAISKIVSGKTLVRRKADLSSFIKRAPHYPVIHLATHGKASGRNGALSFLAFTEIRDSIDNEYLYLSGLQGYNLNAEMVVLSACESGIGEFQYGEGLISIARGFALANAKSVISTLWSINDAKTVGLMTFFYQYLKKAETKSKSLQRAKIDFLHQCTHDEAHPFFWSAFVPYGDMRAFDVSNPYKFNTNFLIFALFLGFTLWIILKLKKRPALK